MDDERHPIVTGVGVLTVIAAAVISTWFTVIAFVGGTMPIIDYETEGGLFFGLFWLVIIDPIVLTVCWWITMLVMTPFIAGASGIDAWRQRRKQG